MKVTISREGVYALRALCARALAVAAKLDESSCRLESTMVILGDKLGDIGEYLCNAASLCIRRTSECVQLTNSFVDSLESTASAIEGYLDANSSICSELHVQKSEHSRPSEWLATNGIEAASIMRTKATPSTMETIRNEMTRRAHRHPVQGGKMYDAGHVEISSEEYSNTGTFYWVPDSSRMINGMSVALIMEKYNIQEIEYKNGFPVFPEHIIIAEITLPNLLSDCRYKNYAASNAVLLNEAVIEDESCCKSNQFAGMVNAYLSEIGVDEKWFQSERQVRDFIRRYDLTWHEKEDMLTLQLLPRVIHELAPHDGGISYARLRDATARDIELLSYEAARKRAAGRLGGE